MKKKLGEILVNSGAVSGADVTAALSDQSAGEPSRLGDLLVATGKLSSLQLARALAEQYQLPYVELPLLPQAVLDLVPLDLQRQFRIVPLKSEGAELWIAMADLSNIEVLAVLEQQWTKVHVNVAGGDEIDALHATLSGIFAPLTDGVGSVPPSISLSPTVNDLFGSFDFEQAPELATTASAPSPVPGIAPVGPGLHAVPRPAPVASSSAGPRAEDLFGDLNLDSARTGIPAKPFEEASAAPVKNVTMPLGVATVSPPAAAPPLEAGEGTGPLLDMLFTEGSSPMGELLLREGTGPVVDTPFFSDSGVGVVVPAISDAPFASSRSSLSALTIAPSPARESIRAAAPAPSAWVGGEALPDWLSAGAGETPQQADCAPWTGALDHLMPSKLVVGVTRALLARGLLTEEEILAALGQKK